MNVTTGSAMLVAVQDTWATKKRSLPQGAKVRLYTDNCLVVDLTVHGDRIAFDLLVEDRIRLVVFGRNHTANIFLRSLFGKHDNPPVKRDSKYVLGEWSLTTSPATLATDASAKVESLVQQSSWGNLEKQASPITRGQVPAFWWDGRVNFGDLIAPWLVGEMTQKQPVNVRGSLAHPGAVMSVGSVINMLERPGYHIWGSGLITPITTRVAQRLRPRKPASIRAVRGWRTREELTRKLGWDVPPVYGDPGLLLPRVYEPQGDSNRSGGIVFVPHYKHKKFLTEEVSDSVDVLDVEQCPQPVVDEIASASHVVASSLHGIIVAQAYGVPWTWLQIDGAALGGDRFKFEDFFTVLERDAVSEQIVDHNELTSARIAQIAAKSTLPATKFSFDELWDSYPHDARFGAALRRREIKTRLARRGRRLVRGVLSNLRT